jgi:hypothetical protein
MLKHQLIPEISCPGNPLCICGNDRKVTGLITIILIFGGLLLYLAICGPEAYSQARLPGTDASDKLEAAGTLLRLIDTGLFKWGARIFGSIAESVGDDSV